MRIHRMVALTLIAPPLMLESTRDACACSPVLVEAMAHQSWWQIYMGHMVMTFVSVVTLWIMYNVWRHGQQRRGTPETHEKSPE